MFKVVAGLLGLGLVFTICTITSDMLPFPIDPVVTPNRSFSAPPFKTAAPTPTQIHIPPSDLTAAEIPFCSPLSGDVIYVQVATASPDNRHILRYQVDGTFCNLLSVTTRDEVIRFDADGGGAIFRSIIRGGYYHGSFVDGQITSEPLRNPPLIPDPRYRSSDETIYLENHVNELWLYPSTGATIAIRMPSWVTEIIWAEWVSRPD